MSDLLTQDVSEPTPQDFTHARLPWSTASNGTGARTRRPRPVLTHDGTRVPDGLTLSEYEAELVRHGLNHERARRCIMRRAQVGGDCQPDRPAPIVKLGGDER